MSGWVASCCSHVLPIIQMSDPVLAKQAAIELYF